VRRKESDWWKTEDTAVLVEFREKVLYIYIYIYIYIMRCVHTYNDAHAHAHMRARARTHAHTHTRTHDTAVQAGSCILVHTCMIV
jgi:hypothetical protein